MFSNAEILAAVVTRWIMPLAGDLLSRNIQCVPFLANIQAKVRSSGWVSQSWTVASEIGPFAEPVVRAIVVPVLTTYLRNIPDEQIPQLAHGIVDAAIEKGELSIMEGNIKFSADDLSELKKLLNANLRISEQKTYKLKEDEKC